MLKFLLSESKMSHRRKRGYDDDSGGYTSKKRRTNEHMEIEDRLESLILRVGEKSTSSLESNLEGLSSVLEADLSTYKSKILKILIDCAIKLPDKCTIYTTLIGLLNTKNYNFGGECVELLVKNTKVSFFYTILLLVVVFLILTSKIVGIYLVLDTTS